MSREFVTIVRSFDKAVPNQVYRRLWGKTVACPMAFKRKDIIPAVSLPRAELRNLQTLKPYQHNARTHSKRQIEQIARSIERFGFLNPVLIDASGTIIAGHGRVEAAKLLGLAQIPTLRIEHLTDAEKRAYILADNKLAEKAGWDREILAIELQALVDMDFEIELTGFEMAEVDFLLDEATEIKQSPLLPEDSIPELSAEPPVTKAWRPLVARCSPALLR